MGDQIRCCYVPLLGSAPALRFLLSNSVQSPQKIKNPSSSSETILLLTSPHVYITSCMHTDEKTTTKNPHTMDIMHIKEPVVHFGVQWIMEVFTKITQHVQVFKVLKLDTMLHGNWKNNYLSLRVKYCTHT